MMGGRQIARVLRSVAGEKRLPITCRTALILMAWHALDGKGRRPEDPPGVYWGGHTQLALEVYGATQNPETRKRNIRRVIRELETRKLVAPYAVTPGGRVAYRLLPSELDTGGSTDPP
jgi:hypothetical protein